MKAALVFLLLVVLSCAQRTTRPPPTEDGRRTLPPIRPTLAPAPESQCSIERRCPEGQMCVSTRFGDLRIMRCVPTVDEDGNCMRRELVDGDTDERKVVDDPRMFDPEKVNRERAAGARDRDNARSITGVAERPSCSDGLNCVDDTCRTRSEPTMCDVQRMVNPAVRCMENGYFQPLQCRRLANETDRTRDPTALRCYCVNPRSGDRAGRIDNVQRREELPDCEGRSFMRCTAMRDNRMVFVRNGESLPEGRGSDGCRRCECNNGNLTCSQPADNTQSCGRSDPNTTPRNCMTDGGMVMHGQQRMDGNCNRCGCRNGTLVCTRVPECRRSAGDMDAGDRDEQREAEDMQCDQCTNMTRNPMCAISEGRTFPTPCHAMRCQGFQMNELAEGACADRDACEEDQACERSVCMRRGGQTRMSRQGAMPEQRRLCVNRTNLQCLPTVRSGDRERLDNEGEDDPIEGLERDDGNEGVDEDDDGNSDDSTVCASDGNTYPSTCHMMTRSTGDMVPRVRYSGRCADSDGEGNDGDTREMVCATDGMTYENKRAVRAEGGNVRMDYMGRCSNPDRDDDNTPFGRCRNVMDGNRCPNLTRCTRRVMPSDGCCPVCGSTVIMAIDQEALDEHIRATGQLDDVDDFMGRFFHEDTDREPAIRSNVTRRCEISMTRPTTTPGNNAEVLFSAKDMAMDAGYCHMQAMQMMMRLNDNQMITQTAVPSEEAFVAAAVVAPEVTDGIVSPSGAPAFAASILVMLSAVFAGLFF